MISVVGLSPERASELLKAEGYSVELEEARSKKGVEGETQARVIRQRLIDETRVLLTFSFFRTEPGEPNA